MNTRSANQPHVRGAAMQTYSLMSLYENVSYTCYEKFYVVGTKFEQSSTQYIFYTISIWIFLMRITVVRLTSIGEITKCSKEIGIID